MKCEYCENEMMNPVGETCPFCGAAIASFDIEETQSHSTNSQTLTTPNDKLPFYVVCKKCGRTTDSQIFDETGKCSWCGSETVCLDVSSSFKQLDLRDSGESKMVRCPKCHRDTDLRELVDKRKCKWCNEDLLPVANIPKRQDENKYQYCMICKDCGRITQSYCANITACTWCNSKNIVPNTTSNKQHRGTKATDTPQISKIRSLITSLRQDNIFSGIDVSDYGFMPTAGEIVYEVVDDIVLNESRSIRRSHTEKIGSSVYDYEGRSETKTHYEFQKVTRGNLFLTNRRVVFTGGQQVRNIKFDDIISFESDWKRVEGSIQISSSKRTKAMRFTDADVFKFTLIYNAIRSSKFRALIEKGPDDELIAKLVEVGLFYTPPVPVRTPQTSTNNHPSAQEQTIIPDGCLFAIAGILLLLFFSIIIIDGCSR